MSTQKNKLYWAMNLPLQIFPNDDGEGYTVLNYMPRKEQVRSCDLEELLGAQTREEFLESAALHLENLARLMREAITDPTKTVYYPAEGMTK